jgi:hypothetical protein
MSNFLCILKTLAAWLIFMIVGTNLVGWVVRGFYDWTPAPTAELSDPARAFFDREIKRMNVASIVMTLLGAMVLAAYLFALFYFWNSLLAIAAAIPMAARIPDLIWEIRTGQKVTTRTGPKGLLGILTTIADWAAIPLVWYALCRYMVNA